VIKIQKVSNLPKIQLDNKLNKTKKEESKSPIGININPNNTNHNSNSTGNITGRTSYATEEDPPVPNETPHNTNTSNVTLQKSNNLQPTRLNDENKKAMESILNSSTSSSGESDIYEEESKLIFPVDCVTVLRNYDSYTTNSYYYPLSKKSVRRYFEDIYLAKYNYYRNNITLIIDEGIHNVTNTVIENDSVYIFSFNRLKCYKISKNGKTFKNEFYFDNFGSSSIDHFSNLFFPLSQMQFVSVNGTQFSFYKNDNLYMKKEFESFFKYEQNYKNLEIVKLVHVYKNPKSGGNYVNFIISGLCKINQTSTSMNSYTLNQLSNQFLSTISIDNFSSLEEENVNTKSKLKILKEISPITDIVLGPFQNGPILTGHMNGTVVSWSIYDLTVVKSIRVFDIDVPIIKIINEPIGLTICCSENKIHGFNLLEKKFEYYFNENEDNELERVVIKNSSQK
jgi:hypothetical protein